MLAMSISQGEAVKGALYTRFEEHPEGAFGVDHPFAVGETTWPMAIGHSARHLVKVSAST